MPASIHDIANYRLAAPGLATSGQPGETQLAAIAEAGFEVVINLALHDDPRYSLADEPGVVRSLGLRYVHIPVRFDRPTQQDLEAFFAAMDACKDTRVWLHCAANLRVTAFLGLYRRLREGWTEEEAFALLHDVWEPNETWAAFIASQLARSVRADGDAAR